MNSNEDSTFFRSQNDDVVVERYYDNNAFEDNSESTITVTRHNEAKPLMVRSKRQNENYWFLLVLDAILFVIEYLQIFALLQSLSLRWTWPIEWTRRFSFLFIFNLDFWEIAKVAKSGVYEPARNLVISSANIPINYRAMLLCWLIIVIAGIISFFVLNWYFSKKLQYAALHNLRTVAVITVQISAIPFGVLIGKLFWCQADNTLDVENSIMCWSAEHIIYIVISLLLAVCVYLVYPVILIVHINTQVITKNSRKHEMYMRLKHLEHLYQLNSSWSDQLFFIFASFRRFWVHHKPVTHLLKFLILCFYAGAFSNRLVQISAIFGILTLWLIMSLVRLPYRVTSYNFPNALNLACLTACAVIGTMQNIDGLQSVFLLPDYILGELILIYGAWQLGTALWIAYMVLRILRILWRRSPLWPALLKPGRNGVTENTQRYIEACVAGKKALDAAKTMPALLSPVHILAHHIKVLNAFACEAEYIRDPLQSTLRDVLDDVIQLHNKHIGVSIFTESMKAYVHTTVTNLIEMLPAFSKRLQQREFDLILVTPLRRRILLKMFAVACFLRAGREKSAYERGVRRLWKSPSLRDIIMDEGFHEDDENVILMKDIKLAPKSSSRPVSVQSYRKSDVAVLPIEESVA